VVSDAEKARVMVMTDIGGDPDDRQSLVRYLLYACDVRTEGLLTGLGWGHNRQTRPDLIRQAVEQYAKVLPNLRKHRRDYPSAEHLLRLIKAGRDHGKDQVGEGQDSEASDWIIEVLDRPDPRPVWFTIWGGPRELAQAIWKLEHTRPAAEAAALKRKIRVHSIADQDETAKWVKKHHPDVFWIYSNRVFRGMYQGYDKTLVSPTWLERNVLATHGPLATAYPPKAAGKDGVKEGDTPSFFYVLPNGLSDPEHPTWGSWGGRFRPSGRGHEFVDAADSHLGHRPDPMWTVARWRGAYQAAFEARMDWCVRPFAEANHAPRAVCNGDGGRGVIAMDVEPGARVQLAADGSFDPDGDALSFNWWVYDEASSYRGEVPIAGDHKTAAVVTVPAEAEGRDIHVILEVKDNGRPPLVASRRIILRVLGEPEPWAGPLRPGEATKPVTELPGPPEKTGPWAFYRGINLNGEPVTIDGQKWEGDDAANFVCKERPLNVTDVTLRPPTDDARAKMIHAFRWNRRFQAALTDVTGGTYAVYIYVWEETAPETFTVAINGRKVADVDSGLPGAWQRLGPFRTAPADGTIEITATGGAANISGIELWRKAE
jgi:hypothetical protein